MIGPYEDASLYDLEYADHKEDIAFYVDRVLRGVKPADLPIEQPLSFEFVVNLKAAEAIGVKIPQSVLLRADRVLR